MAKKETNEMDAAVAELEQTMAESEAAATPQELKEATIARNAAWKVLLDYVTAQTKDPAILDAAKLVRPSYFGLVGSTGPRGDGLTRSYRRLLALKADFKVGDKFTSLQLFQVHKMGATEARHWINELTLFPTPAGHPLVWVSYDKLKDEYEIKAIQNTVPEGWTGYIPAALNGGKCRQAL